jgi:hypothetical protein
MEEDIEVTTPSEASFDGDYDYKPLDKSFLQRMEEKVFRVMSGQFLKRKRVEKKEPVAAPNIDDDLFEDTPAIQATQSKINPIDGNPIVLPEPVKAPVKTSLFQRIKAAIKFPAISKVNAVINGIALAVFAAGSYVLYTALPTRPELVLGIIMVSVAGNVIVSSR